MSEEEHKVSKLSSEAIFAERPVSASKFLISIVFCLSLIIIDLRFNTSSIFRGYVQDFLSPLHNLIQLPKSLVTNFSESMTSKEELRESLEKHKEDINKLMVMNSQLAEITRRNQELDLVWNSVQMNKEAYSLAQKRSLSNNPFRPILVLNIDNSRSIIKVNQPVLSNEGVMGKISSLGLGSAEVMMVHDPRSMIPIISSSTRIHGVVQGRGLKRTGRLVNLKKTSLLREGENLYSSGLGGVFPPNFLVGKIISVKDRPDDEFLSVEVEFLDFPEEKDFFLIFTG